MFKIDRTNPVFVIHAGGSSGDYKHLNCLEQVEHYVDSGQTFIELDFIFTSDDEIIGSHYFEHYDGYSMKNRPSLQEAITTKVAGKYTTLTFVKLAEIMAEHPNVKIIFDTKEDDSEKMLKKMLEIAESKSVDLKNRMIVQVYSQKNYLTVSKLGFVEYWFTNYKAKYLPSQIIRYFDSYDDVTTIVMSTYNWKLYRSLNFNPNKKIAVYSANTQADIKFLQNRGVDYIYRDYIS